MARFSCVGLRLRDGRLAGGVACAGDFVLVAIVGDRGLDRVLGQNRAVDLDRGSASSSAIAVFLMASA